MNIQYQKKHINTWNIFSRSILINNFTNKINTLIITRDEDINKKLKILDYLKSKITIVDNFSTLIDVLYNKNKSYIIWQKAFYKKIPNKYQIENNFSLKLKKNDYYKIDDVIKKLNDFWYKYRDYLEGWDYKKQWDLLYIKIKNSNHKIVISFFWDIVENIFLQFNENQLDIEYITIWENKSLNNFEDTSNFNTELIDIINSNNTNVIVDNLDINKDYDLFLKINNITTLESLKNINYKQLDLKITDIFINNIDNLLENIKIYKTNFYTKNTNTIKSFCEYNNIEKYIINKSTIPHLKSFKAWNELFICDDVLSRIFAKKRLKKSISQNVDLMLQIKPWDYVVHIDHWVWIFTWIVSKEIYWNKKEFLEISYKNNDKIFTPITSIWRVSKYIWKENPTLTSLNSKEWSKKINKASEDAEKIAKDLLEIYAKRSLLQWQEFIIDKQKMSKFQDSFEFNYTQDQINAIDEILSDLSNKKPMDRILIWDVWFWKTEVAFNAIYASFINKKQSVLISPLVVLAYEHYSKAIDRFAWLGMNIEILTRFETASKAKQILSNLKSWKIDLVIWTHRLLWKEVVYNDLWLLVIDEEHKFWVSEKEKINEIAWRNYKPWSNFSHKFPHVLSMSATPIPRSLNMALNSIKWVSILRNPPPWRKPIETYVSIFDDNIIIDACKKEFDRWWQVFFVHNRVATIEWMLNYLQKLFPSKKIIVTHWQLEWDELENRIIDFKNKKYDILLSSTVIENWIDFPNVNTIIINDAYKFWISQIHQLRWRVWRSDKQGYCLLLFNKEKINPDSAKRLQTIVEYSHLWAWFELSLKDLEIRWWGDILWIKQSWNSSDIWINTFLKLLEEKIEELKIKNKNTPKKEIIKTNIELNIDAFLDDIYFDSDIDKLNFYKEIESFEEIEDINNVYNEFSQENKINSSAKNFFRILKLRLKLWEYFVLNVKKVWINYELNFKKDISIDDLKKFLDKDSKVIFSVVSIDKIRTNTKNFKDDFSFFEYLESMFAVKKKIKLIKK